jgi:hypothetical protein
MFAPKVDESTLLGYASNAHGYRVLNKTPGCVDATCDVSLMNLMALKWSKLMNFV